jgi:hypothetical protein
MVARNRGRYLAPIAIVIVIAAAVLIIQGELGSKRHAHSHPAELSGLVHRGNRRAATSYIVKSGDSLSSISVRTGVSVPALESLNPGVDPSALQAGQHLKLRR